MTATLETVVERRLNSRDLIDEPLWQRLVGRIVRKEQVEPRYAERVMDQALGFLSLCAARPSEAYGPSQAVDVGWHTFLLYTREYAEFCERTAGHFIHHAPMDEQGVDYGEPLDTVAAMREEGIPVDEELWPLGADAESTHRCTGDGDCTNANKSGRQLAPMPGLAAE